jgi:hypothetical protein
MHPAAGLGEQNDGVQEKWLLKREKKKRCSRQQQQPLGCVVVGLLLLFLSPASLR